tara:strand:+ start:43284 stop:44003 length:720 start_codon:yes stop_codon:yes gene_type:complete
MNAFHKKKTDCNSCRTLDCLIKKCNPATIQVLSQKKIQLLLKKGQSIFQENAPVFGLFFIQKGDVKIESSSLDGKKQIVRLATDGHILGHIGFGHETYPIGATAIQDARVCFMDSGILMKALKDNFSLSFEIMMFYSKELRKSEIRTKYLAQMTVSEKVAFSLIYLVNTFGMDPDSQLLNVSFSRTEFGNMAGTNSDQVSRTITQLKNDSFIDTKGHKIKILNLAGLQQMLVPYGYEWE